ncbi:MAG: homocysteine S-methyltransferase family protein [Pseudomonadales bacterium]|nr:homocysteine S-methyltransferase family protein [Pseudomonadales bacterium]
MKYRHALPQLCGQRLLSDGGLETTLIFQDGIELSGFAAIDMLTTPERRRHLRRYFEDYIEMAIECGTGFILESPTWRSSHGWAEAVGYSADTLDELNHLAIEMMLALASKYDTPETPMVVSGCIGPRGDGYVPAERMTAEETRRYHSRQIEIFADAGADCVSAFTMNYADEAIGIALAARDARIPGIISFTVETDGSLATGETLAEAITTVDEATDGSPAYYMINCAHPTHFESALDPDSGWTRRVVGLRANASKCSHAELDNSTELDTGNPDELAESYRRLTDRMPHVGVIGGCCGTDMRHIRAIADRHFENRLCVA